jgi:carbon starvation protein CstA
MHSFGEAFYRLFGSWAKHLINILLAFQLLCVVAVLTLWNGQAISQISQGTICFVVCLTIFMAAGLIVAQIRTLVRFSWLANFAVWINILVLCIW